MDGRNPPNDRKMLISRGGIRHAVSPATKSMPKEMLPIVNKPLVQYGVEGGHRGRHEQLCLRHGPRQAGDR
jgi:UTP-glucose-1-phosphate uridylyltransferase